MVSLCALCSEKNFHLQQTNMRPFEKRKDFLITIFFDYKKPFPLSRYREFLPSRHCEERSDESISPLLHPVIANRRVGKCAGVKQSPHCSFLLVLSVLRGLLRSLRSLAMTRRKCSLAMTPLSSLRGAKRRSNLLVASCISFYKNSLLTRCKVFIPEGLG